MNKTIFVIIGLFTISLPVSVMTMSGLALIAEDNNKCDILSKKVNQERSENFTAVQAMEALNSYITECHNNSTK